MSFFLSFLWFYFCAPGDEQSIPQGITEWERQRGRSELTRAAGLHKPVSSMMASRFVSAQYKDEEVVQYGETNQVDIF